MHGRPKQIPFKAWRKRTSLFKLLKKQDKFRWSQEAADALEDLKQHIQSPAILTAPMPGDDLLYIATTTHVVSTTIVVERKEEGHTYGV